MKQPSFATVETSTGVWRAGIVGTDRITMMIGVNLAGYYSDANRYRNAFIAVVPLALLFLALGGWFISDRALRPVALVTRTAERITATALDERVPYVNADRELSRLVEVINGMLDRLEKSFRQAVRFSADAAHELQTPLTILQGELDDAVQHAAMGSEEQRRYGSLLDEVRRLKAIVQKLLVLARVDAGRLELRREATDLSSIVDSAAEDAEALAPDLTVEKTIPRGISVLGDPHLIGQVIQNVMSNAVKYNRPGGLIRFLMLPREDAVDITISNTGTPIPEKDREKIFDRFYRVDRSRGGKVAGAGLGLSLAREIARAHQGDLRLDPDAEDLISFTLTLPR
jgi:heavy metal sensor kinase